MPLWMRRPCAWLETQGLTAPRLRWYLDYCCRDDYGALADTVSVGAGLHHFLRAGMASTPPATRRRSASRC